jgi:hypothetical protein
MRMYFSGSCHCEWALASEGAGLKQERDATTPYISGFHLFDGFCNPYPINHLCKFWVVVLMAGG